MGSPEETIGSQPFIDEHRITISAPPEAVWDALVRYVRHQRGPAHALGARLLGARPSRSSEGELEVGSTIPGFAVVRIRAPELLVLQGAHRFSTYTLVFRLSPGDGVTAASALSAARFPGAAGRLYRAAVVGSGMHRVAVRAMLLRIAAAVR